MNEKLILFQPDNPIPSITLNDPDHRNALGLSMFEALQNTLKITSNLPQPILLLKGTNPVFSAGFDLQAAIQNPENMAHFITQLSQVNRTIRRLPQIVIAVVQGAALAGGCALLGACDFVFVAPNAKLGYPVHRIGVSPAVTIPTLRSRMLPGPMRTLLLSGKIITGITAHKIGLATHLATSDNTLNEEANSFAIKLNEKSPHALRTTKAWLNKLDDSLNNQPFDDTVNDSIPLTNQPEATQMLQSFWNSRR